MEELARKERRKIRVGYGKIRIDGQVVEMGRGARSTEGRKEQGERGEAEGKGEREEGVRRIEEGRDRIFQPSAIFIAFWNMARLGNKDEDFWKSLKE